MKTSSRTIRSVAVGGLLLSSLSVAACDDTGGSLSGDPAAESTDAVSNAQILYQESFAETGTLTVAEAPGGLLMVNIEGGIGADDEEIALAEEAGGQPTLEEAYLTLFPEATEVPEEVQELSARIVQLQEEQPAESGPQEDAPPPVAASGVDKTESAFLSNCCVTRYYDWDVYTPIDCPYVTASPMQARNVCTDSGAIMNYLYRSWYWNDTGVSALHFLLGYSGSYYTVNPYRWGVHWWVGGFTNATACLNQTAAVSESAGGLGITAHAWSPRVK